MKSEIALVNAKYLLKKFPGKGGWTYAEIPEVSQDKNNPFGWVRVKGSIDDFPLHPYKLMPMGNGKLFLPVKAAVRKTIRKEAGDYVHVILYADNSIVEISQEIMDCFKNESPSILKSFEALTQSQQKAYIDWIYQARTDETRAQRISEMMERIEKNLTH